MFGIKTLLSVQLFQQFRSSISSQCPFKFKVLLLSCSSYSQKFAMFLMPLNLCPSMYSYSRLPTEGLPSEVESMLRCMRIYSHGTWLAEETERFVILSISLISMCILSIYIQLGMGCRVLTSFIFSISAQQGKSGRLQFTAPTIQKPISSGNELI